MLDYCKSCDFTLRKDRFRRNFRQFTADAGTTASAKKRWSDVYCVLCNSDFSFDPNYQQSPVSGIIDLFKALYTLSVIEYYCCNIGLCWGIKY